MFKFREEKLKNVENNNNKEILTPNICIEVEMQLDKNRIFSILSINVVGENPTQDHQV